AASPGWYGTCVMLTATAKCRTSPQFTDFSHGFQPIPYRGKEWGAVQELWCKMAALRVGWLGCRKPSSAPGPNCKPAAMLTAHASAPSSAPQDREARIATVMDQLRPAAEQALRRMAEDLVDAPDSQLFQGVELRLRDHAHELAAAAHQA